MKYTLNEFASQIRNLYPNDYDDLTDEKLVELWLKKYPEDIEKIDFKIVVPQKKSKNIIEHSIEFIFAIAVLVFLFIGVMYIKDPENVKNRLGLTKNNNSTYIEDNSSSSEETNIEDEPSSSEETIIEDNSSVNEQTFIDQSSSQQQEQRKCNECKGTGQCPKCSKPQRVRYKQGESPNDHNEIRQGMIVCTQCGGNLMNFGADKNKSCYLCKASGWLYCPECNSSGNGSYIGKCKRCKGTGFDR